MLTDASLAIGPPIAAGPSSVLATGPGNQSVHLATQTDLPSDTKEGIRLAPSPIAVRRDLGVLPVPSSSPGPIRTPVALRRSTARKMSTADAASFDNVEKINTSRYFTNMELLKIAKFDI